MSKNALIVGAGSGNSAAFARALAADGYRVVLAARNISKLESLCAQIDAQAVSCDATSVESVADLFKSVEQSVGKADVVLYNASAYTAGPITDLDPGLVLDSLMQTAYGAFLVAQQAAIAMKQLGGGALFFTGATASIKGFPNLHPLRWASLRCADWRKAWRENSGPRIFMSHTSSSMAVSPLRDGI